MSKANGIITVDFPSTEWKDYEIIDSGDFEKLERFGRYILRRPEPKALWHKSMSEAQWASLAHTCFKPGAGFAKAGKEDSGTWEMLKKMDEQWKIHYPLQDGGDVANSTVYRSAGLGGRELTLRLGLTSFKHVGIFPEQASNWDWIYTQTRAMAERMRRNAGGLSAAGAVGAGFAGTVGAGAVDSGVAGAGVAGAGVAARPKVLNLFAYTGAASLAAKAAGADVTHLDSVKQVVTWGRQNMELSGMQDIRWVVEDAMKFVRREVRRGNHYNGIILDPPAYGHGPDGEKWKLDECLLEMLGGVAELLDKDNFFMVLNLYSNGYSAALADTLVRQAFKLGNGNVGANENTGTNRNVGANENVCANKNTGTNENVDADGNTGTNRNVDADGNISLECGELALADKFGKNLPLSVYVRLATLR